RDGHRGRNFPRDNIIGRVGPCVDPAPALNTDVDLNDMDARPGDNFACQSPEHKPGSMTTADGHDEAAARRHGARASTAMVVAPFRATASTSARTSIFTRASQMPPRLLV